MISNDIYRAGSRDGLTIKNAQVSAEAPRNTEVNGRDHQKDGQKPIGMLL